MLSAPSCLAAVVYAVRLARDLGLVRLPSPCPRVAGIRYAGVVIRLVAGVVKSGAETAPLGIIQHNRIMEALNL